MRIYNKSTDSAVAQSDKNTANLSHTSVNRQLGNLSIISRAYNVSSKRNFPECDNVFSVMQMQMCDRELDSIEMKKHFVSSEKTLFKFFFLLKSIRKPKLLDLTTSFDVEMFSLKVRVTSFLLLHFIAALSVNFEPLHSSFALNLSLLRHLLVNAFHLENVFHFCFLVVLEISHQHCSSLKLCVTHRLVQS